jgi:hypothetical protein
MHRSATCAPGRVLGVLVTLVVGLLAGPVASATAAAPPNDAPQAAGTFEPFTAENGNPRDLQAVAEMSEATPDPGVPRCLGPSSFARTVWYVIPAVDAPQELTVEATGRTLDVIDLAAFVQPEGATAPLTSEPNACSGLGAGGSDAAEEPTSGVTLRVPARRMVLVQVGRRGAVGSAEDERVILSLDARPLTLPPRPAGDIATPTTPRARSTAPTFVPLGGATTTEEDPAQPACPALGSVWRRIVPSRSGTRLISATGGSVTTLTAFAGKSPTGDNALDCVDRAGFGALQMRVPVRRGRTLWIRLGTDRPADSAEATLSVGPGKDAFVVDGGPGGFDPTTGGPGGGLPPECAKSRPGRARIGGTGLRGKVKQLNKRPNVTLAVNVSRSPVCDVELELVGPHGHVYAAARAVRLKGRSVVRLPRVRALIRGGYRLHVTAVSSQLGDRVRVRTDLRGRLR